MTKRTGAGTLPPITSASMKLTWLLTMQRRPVSGMCSSPRTLMRYMTLTKIHDRNRIRNSGTSV